MYFLPGKNGLWSKLVTLIFANWNKLQKKLIISGRVRLPLT